MSNGGEHDRNILLKQIFEQCCVNRVDIAYKAIINYRVISFVRKDGISINATQTNGVAMMRLELSDNVFINIACIHHCYDLQSFRIGNSPSLNEFLFDL